MNTGTRPTSRRRVVVRQHDWFGVIDEEEATDIRFGTGQPPQAQVSGAAKSRPVDSDQSINAKGHPPRVHRVAQCVELFHQPLGEAADRVAGAWASAVTIVKGPATNGG
ncbi:hypothetical protein TUM20985_16810 [Mycobacterium antarcticum]|nr:hypothetical protein TUM20985_16810 [Mycolicibacterium sp. TUM20985]GLP74486.1 hypothetical protein TUM20983_15960 [Mycolicibacterium sp. TUM20983]GLP80281.1 hypothetical protein TUM20984_17010 [Mycolicibacterium sp. TUM20984]